MGSGCKKGKNKSVEGGTFSCVRARACARVRFVWTRVHARAARPWCLGTITQRNVSPYISKTIEGKKEKVNFYVHYDVDDDEVKTVLRVSEYGESDEMGWVLLEASV